MKYYIFIQNDVIIGSGQAEILNEDVNTVEVSEELYNKFNEDKDYLVWDVENQEVVINPDYDEIKARQREELFKADFFKTSLGYIRRKVHMKDGSIKDFISDLIPLMEGATGIPIIAYGEPDFTKEVTEQDLIDLQIVVTVTPEFIKECKDQAIVDFYGYNPIELLMMQQAQQQPEAEEEEEPEEELDNVEE